MDSESIVYGCITDTSSLVDVERRRMNRKAVACLPSAEQWQFLNREMFSVPENQHAKGEFVTEVMHFGSSYTSVEYEWDQWIAQFEKLLRSMYWISATVHLDTELRGAHSFVWTPSGEFHIPGDGNINVQCEWIHDTSF